MVERKPKLAPPIRGFMTRFDPCGASVSFAERFIRENPILMRWIIAAATVAFLFSAPYLGGWLINTATTLQP